nr:DEA(D/H)-box RNA helicase family protein [Tanacetum cinerariifolium]
MHKAFPLPAIKFPLPEELPTASEDGSHCQKKRDATARKIALLSMSRRNYQSKMAITLKDPDLSFQQAILHVMNQLIEDRNTPYGHTKVFNMAWYLDDDTIIRYTLVVRNVLELIIEDGPCHDLHLKVDKSECVCDEESSQNIELMDSISKIDALNVSCCFFLPVSVYPSNIFLCAHALPGSLSEPNVLLMLLFGLLYCVLSLRLDPYLLIGNGGLPPYCLNSGASEPAFEDALCGFNAKMDIDLLSNPIDCGKAKEKSYYVLNNTPCLLPAWISKASAHQRRGRAGRVRPANVTIWISTGKEVDIGLSGVHDKPLRLADMLLYSWDEELDVCVDHDFVHVRVVIDATQRKCVKYEAKRAEIIYGFLPFLFFSLG